VTPVAGLRFFHFSCPSVPLLGVCVSPLFQSRRFLPRKKAAEMEFPIFRVASPLPPCAARHPLSIALLVCSGISPCQTLLSARTARFLPPLFRGVGVLRFVRSIVTPPEIPHFSSSSALTRASQPLKSIKVSPASAAAFFFLSVFSSLQLTRGLFLPFLLRFCGWERERPRCHGTGRRVPGDYVPPFYF